jgi:hypothetical protein
MSISSSMQSENLARALRWSARHWKAGRLRLALLDLGKKPVDLAKKPDPRSLQSVN